MKARAAVSVITTKMKAQAAVSVIKFSQRPSFREDRLYKDRLLFEKVQRADRNYESFVSLREYSLAIAGTLVILAKTLYVQKSKIFFKA